MVTNDMAYIQFRVIEKVGKNFKEEQLKKFREQTRDLPIATCRITANKVGIALIPSEDFLEQATGTGIDCFAENEQWGRIAERVANAIMQSELWKKGELCNVQNLGVWFTQIKEQGDYGTDIDKIPEYDY